MNTLPPNLAGEFQLTLDNLSLANLLSKHLLAFQRRGITKIPTDVWFNFPGDSVNIPGENCGFLTIPIIHCALLDVRRILEFLKLRFDRKTGTLESFSENKFPDDFSILDLQLPPVSPDALFDLSLKTTGKPPTGILTNIYNYTNKGLAHFTKTNMQPDWPDVIDCTHLMKVALLVFVYDALQIPRPKIQPKTG